MASSRWIRGTTLCAIGFLTISVFVAVPAAGAQGGQAPLPEHVATRSVDIWSEGTRLAGDLYFPDNLEAGDTLPTIVLCHGWGGVKRGLRRLGGKLAAEGYLVLAFDYRGWGESDSRLVIKGESPEPDGNGEAMVRVQMIREVVDPLAEAEDIHNVLNFIVGEPGVDTDRIGLWGSSYGGGLVVWTAAHDDRVKAVVAQVPGMGAQSAQRRALGLQRAIEHARGTIEPIPQGIDAVQGLRGTPHVAHMARYNAVEAATLVNVPTLIIDAENEELMDRTQNGRAAYEQIARKGNVPTRYEVIKGISHYDVYRGSFDVASDMAVDWFNQYLKSDN